MKISLKKHEIPKHLLKYFRRDPEAAPIRWKHKDLVNTPFLVAEALRADGWYLRSDVPWVKRDPMPEPAPDRPAKALEYFFLFAKSQNYYFDKVVISKALQSEPHAPGNNKLASERGPRARMQVVWGDRSGRSFRNTDLWFDSVKSPHGLVGHDDEWLGLDVTGEDFPLAHFATYPPQLIKPLILSGTSQKGCCPDCGAPWKRIVDKRREPTRPGLNTKVKKVNLTTGNRDPERHDTSVSTLGWYPSCRCAKLKKLPKRPKPDDLKALAKWRAIIQKRVKLAETLKRVPCVVLDPFGGSGTTGLVCQRLGRRFVLCELNEEYARMAADRIKVRGKVGRPKKNRPQGFLP